MKVKLITTASDLQHDGFLMLQKSLEKFGWDWDLCGTDYASFGSKMVNAYNYAKQTDCSHLFIVDAYDVVVLGTMEEALSKIPDKEVILFNAEKNAWPYEQWAMLYPEVHSPWKYLNGGVAFVSVLLFIKMFEDNPIYHSDNDQVNLASIYITNKDKYKMKLDTPCEVFQTMNSISSSDLERLDNGFNNLLTGTSPLIFHGNGRHPMDDIYELLK